MTGSIFTQSAVTTSTLKVELDPQVSLPKVVESEKDFLWYLPGATLKITKDGRVTDWVIGGKFYTHAFMSGDYQPREGGQKLPREAVGIRFGFTGKDTDRFSTVSTSIEDENRRLIFEMEDRQKDSMTRGMKIRHTLFYTGEYRIRWETTLENPTDKAMPLHPSADPGKMLGLIFGIHDATNYWTTLATGMGSDLETVSPEERYNWPVDAPGGPGTAWNFAAWRSNHFVAAIRSDEPRPLLAGKWSITRPGQTPEAQELTSMILGLSEDQLAPQGSLKTGLEIYIGEKREATMAETPFAPLFDRYGAILGIFERPLFKILEIFHGLTQNWGYSILLLTLTVKLMLLPLNIKQNRSMAAMQAIQPELKKLQDKYADDRQRLSQEMMKLYQKHQVNPLAGCLPMFLQMPVFISLYYTVSSSVEMYGVPFFWIPNLAYEDPFLILPIVFTLSFLLTQRKMTIDPSQKAIMMFMPFLMFFMMMHLPAGVMIYVVGQSLFSNLEQTFTRKPQAVPEVSQKKR